MERKRARESSQVLGWKVSRAKKLAGRQFCFIPNLHWAPTREELDKVKAMAARRAREEARELKLKPKLKMNNRHHKFQFQDCADQKALGALEQYGKFPNYKLVISGNLA